MTGMHMVGGAVCRRAAAYHNVMDDEMPRTLSAVEAECSCVGSRRSICGFFAYLRRQRLGLSVTAMYMGVSAILFGAARLGFLGGVLSCILA